MRKQKVSLWIGVFLLFIGIISTIVHIQQGVGSLMLWYCNHITILGAIFILIGSRFWLNATINVGLLPVLFWIADYLSRILFNYRLLGVVDYVFVEQNKLMFLLYHQHLFVVPFMIIALCYLGNAVKNAWKGSLIYGIALVMISLPFRAQNMNCVHAPCIPFFPNNVVFLILQYAFFVIAIMITNWLINKYIKKN